MNFDWPAVQLLCAYIPIFWILKKRKADCDENCLLACMFILMTVMVLVGTFVGVKLMGLTTLPAVEKKIAAEGFTDVEYNTWMYAVGLIWMKITRRNTTFFKRKRMDRSGRLRRPEGRSACADISGRGLIPLAEIGNFM